MIEKSQRSAAKVLGVVYPLTFVIVTAAFMRFYAPYLNWNNKAETARNFFVHERAIRMYIAAALIYGAGLVALLTALYVILRPVSRALALFAAFCRLAYAFLWFVMLLDIFGALRVMASAGSSPALELDRLPILAGLQLSLSLDAYYIGLGFYGLGTLIFGYLWLKSRYIPRALAAWGMLASTFAGFCAFAFLLFPGFGKVISVNWYELPLLLFELPTSLWVLIKGLRPGSVQG